MTEHLEAMREAIAEARRAQGPCHPNPAVGAVVAQGGRLVARGHTQAPGGDHAEIQALHAYAATGLKPDESTTLYVTLEPCSTHGRTPPCCEAIVRSGIRRVVAGATDPNPRHGGAGYLVLREAGVTVLEGVLAEECADLNLPFNHWMLHRRPLFAAKIATTLDGRIATRNGHSQWITSRLAREDVARWRRAFPAIAVGGGTVLTDDPQLTSRLPDEPSWCPRRLIFDRAGRCLRVPERRVFTDADAARTVYLTTEPHLARVPGAWARRGVQVWRWEDWSALRRRCLDAELTGIYFEGGTSLLSGLLKARELDYLFAYRAPRLLADGEAPGAFAGAMPTTMGGAYAVREVRHAVLGDDQLLRGFLEYPS
jgi:diaminohydroxyphosphoribosylaminopyrimidine deaminase / 5-amino-6-(5-phosphoribosylamino)uracil reductase